MNTKPREWEKQLDDVFFGCYQEANPTELKSFISSLLDSHWNAAIEKCIEVMGEDIRSYFKDLIHIPVPGLTKEKLIDTILTEFKKLRKI